jgi:hypothetical protein
MKRVALQMLPVFVVGLVVLVLRRRGNGRSETVIAEPETSVPAVEVPEAVGYRVEGLHEADMSLDDELREEEEEHRHGALQHLSTQPLAPKMV